MNIQEMNDDACRALIKSERIGRLACSKHDRPYIVPIHYVYSGERIFSFTMPGQKLDFMRHNANVCIEVETIERSDKWKCVLVHGAFHEMVTEEDQQDAWEVLGQYNDWWEVGSQLVQPAEKNREHKPIFFSISMDLTTGREAVSTAPN